MERKRLTSMEDGRVFLLQEELETPAATQVQVRIHATAVSPGTERAFILSLENTDRNYPRVLGYSAAGEVVAVGSEVKAFAVGDRVAGILPHATAGNAEARNLVKIPDGVSYQQAAFVRIGVISMQAVRKARIELGEGVLVLGLGLIGQVAAALAAAGGALPLVGIDPVASKRTLAKTLSGTQALEPGGGAEEQIRALCGGGLPQVVIESTGFPGPINDALALCGNMGRVVLLGSTRGSTEVNFYRDVHKKGLSIIGAHISCNPTDASYPGHWTFRDNADCFLRLIGSGRIDVSMLASSTAHFEDFDTVYTQVLASEKDYISSVLLWN